MLCATDRRFATTRAVVKSTMLMLLNCTFEVEYSQLYCSNMSCTLHSRMLDLPHAEFKLDLKSAMHADGFQAVH